MFSSIRKIRKIRVYFFQNPSATNISGNFENHNKNTDSPTHTYLQQFTSRAKINEILNQDVYANEIRSYNLGETLECFFIKHQSAWYELKRKINAHKKFRNGVWYLGKNDEEEILTIFVRQGRPEGMSDNIERLFRENILKNQALIIRVQNEPSLLDTSHGELSFLKQNQQVSFIEHTIRYGMEGNYDIKEADIQKRFQKLLPIITQYLSSIYQVKFDASIERIRSIHELALYIQRQLWGKASKGIDKKNAWILVKAFAAWGGYPEIKDLQESAKRTIDSLPSKLKEIGCNITSIEEYSKIIDGETFTITKGVAMVCGIECKIEFRVKSMRSILLKLWENEDYNNIDALRDMIGLAVIWPDGVESGVQVSIISTIANMMANKGYLLKDKGIIQNDENPNGLKNLEKSVKTWNKKPLGKVITSKGKKSSKKYRSASISGFSDSFSPGKPMGYEIQFHSDSSAQYWKTDHYTFDPLKVAKGWSRGSWFVTPHQLQNIIKNEIPEDIRNTLIRKTPNQIMLGYIIQGKIIPYIGSDNEIYLVPIDHIGAFEFKKGSNIQKVREIDSKFRKFILELGSQTILHGALAI